MDILSLIAIILLGFNIVVYTVFYYLKTTIIHIPKDIQGLINSLYYLILGISFGFLLANWLIAEMQL